MNITIKKPLGENPRDILRKAGYTEHFDPKVEKTSYSLRLGSGRYPRFHCYLKESEDSVTFSLHIDQKEASYKGSKMHAGEYEGKLVEEEIGRIERWANASKAVGAAVKTTGSNSKAPPDFSGPSLPLSRPPKHKKKGLFGKLFG